MLLHTEPLLPPALPLLAHLLSLLILLMVSRSQLVSWDTPVCVCVFVCLLVCVCVWGGGAAFVWERDSCEFSDKLPLDFPPAHMQ